MLISTRGRYALRVMIDLAEHDDKLVEGLHGKGGGYRLTRKPEDYRISEILRLTEGDLAPVACLECNAEKCKRTAECRTLPMWMELNRRVNEYLDSVTIADLMK